MKIAVAIPDDKMLISFVVAIASIKVIRKVHKKVAVRIVT